jgi:hypothetical protein
VGAIHLAEDIHSLEARLHIEDLTHLHAPDADRGADGDSACNRQLDGHQVGSPSPHGVAPCPADESHRGRHPSEEEEAHAALSQALCTNAKVL